MVRITSLALLLAISFQQAAAQQVLTRAEALNLAAGNRINNAPAQLELQRQQTLLRSATGFESPDLEYEVDPYDPTVLGVLVPLRLPTVYGSRKNLQRERIKLSALLLRLNAVEIARLVQSTYSEVQYQQARVLLLKQQDSLYQAIKTAAQRNFRAGQINKLEELFATNEAANVRNELERSEFELAGQKNALAFITNRQSGFTVEPLSPFFTDSLGNFGRDTIPPALQLQVLQQQISVSQAELKSERAELLPQVTAGPLFGLEPPHGESPKRLGFRLSLSVPLWFGQNRARVAAAQLGVQQAAAEREREQQRLNREYSVALGNFRREQRSLAYYATVAEAQANQIIETARRLFEAGETGYTELLRNILSAYQNKAAYLETVRSYNQTVIELNYLTANF
jgi:outer membrane protein, heavy metal efflux system